MPESGKSDIKESVTTQGGRQ